MRTQTINQLISSHWVLSRAQPYSWEQEDNGSPNAITEGRVNRSDHMCTRHRAYMAWSASAAGFGSLDSDCLPNSQPKTDKAALPPWQCSASFVLQGTGSSGLRLCACFLQKGAESPMVMTFL